MNKTVTVLVPAYNEEAHIGSTLKSLLAQTRIPDCIIVVAHNCSDATESVARATGATLVITCNDTNQKKSIAQNAALPYIQTGIIVTVDADTTLERHAIERLVEPFESDDPPTSTYGYVVSRKPRSVFQRGRDIEVRFQQFFTKRAQDGVNAPLVAPGCIAAWQTAAINKRRHGFASTTTAEDMDLTIEAITNPGLFEHEGGGRVQFVRDALALTTDPKTFRLYWRQTMRWYASFFQNLRVHWRSLFLPSPNGLLPRHGWLSLFVLGYLIDGLAGFGLFFVLPLIAVALQWQWDWHFLFLTVVGFIIARTIFITACSLIEGVRLSRLLAEGPRSAATMRMILSPKDTILSLPCYLFCTDLINRIIWPIAFVREMPVLRRWFSVSTWKKGH